MIRYFFLLSVGHILVSYKSLGPKVNGAPAVNKMNGDQAEETAPTPALKLPDSEDEHKDEDEEMESNDEVAKVIFSDDVRNFWKKNLRENDRFFILFVKLFCCVFSNAKIFRETAHTFAFNKKIIQVFKI